MAASPAGGKADAKFAALRAEMRKALYVPDKLPPLEAKVWSSFSPMPGVIADRVTYRSTDGMLVPAIVYRPEKHKGKLPGIVVVNGHGGNKYSWYAFYSGMMFAQAGAEVVTYDPIGEGERNVDRLAGVEIGDDPARERERVAIVRRVVIGDARAPRVHVGAAELLG